MVAILDKLEDLTFAVVDLETTGFDRDGADRICEVAIVRGKIGQLEPLDTWSTLVNPGRSIPYSATQVNHITNAMVQEQAAFAAVAPQILALVENTVLIFHNGSFDLPFLQAELKRAGADLSRLPQLAADTCTLARNHYDFKSNRLGDLINQLGLADEVQPNHRALNDTLATWRLWCWELEDLRTKGQPLETLEDLMKLHEIPPAKLAARSTTLEVSSQETIVIEISELGWTFEDTSASTSTSTNISINTDTSVNTNGSNNASNSDTALQIFGIAEAVNPIFEQWQNQKLPLNVALPTLCRSFAQLEDISKNIEQQLKDLRAQISEMVTSTGSKIEIPQFGKLQMTPAQVITSFDRKRLEDLVERLTTEGNSELAAAIEACKAESNRAASLRITRTKS
jgi:DNA polymerase III epsilon subunit-like protein